MSSSNPKESSHEHPTDGIRRRHIVDPASDCSITAEVPEAFVNSNLLSSPIHLPAQNGFTPVLMPGMSVTYPDHNMSSQSLGSDLSSLWYGNTFNNYMWSHQMYTDYMNQYMQYLENIGHQSTVPVELNQGENVPPQNNQQGPQPQPAQVMNAQGGAFLLEDDEDDRNRDWLDWAYVIMRFVMLMCILYFYSTPVRFVTFIIASVVFFIYQAGWLAVPPLRRQNENNEHQEVGAAENENRNINEPPRLIPQFVSTLWSIVVCFFVSLAPQVPPPINAN